MTPLSIINGAIDAINEYGWFCGPGSDHQRTKRNPLPEGGCVLEVIAIGAGYPAKKWCDIGSYMQILHWGDDPEYFLNATPAFKDEEWAQAYVEAVQAVIDVLIAEGELAKGATTTSVWNWNDNACQTQERAIEVLTKAKIKLLTTPNILIEAANVIETKGWCRNTLENKQGHVCAAGALSTVVFGDPSAVTGIATSHPLWKAYIKAEWALMRQTEADYDKVSFVAINDRARDRRKITRLMRRAARSAAVGSAK